MKLRHTPLVTYGAESPMRAPSESVHFRWNCLGNRAEQIPWTGSIVAPRLIKIGNKILLYESPTRFFFNKLKRSKLPPDHRAKPIANFKFSKD